MSTHTLNRYLAALALIGSAAHAQETKPANAATVMELQQVDVVGTTPLPGLGIAKNQIPTNVQSVTAKQLQQQGALDLSDYLSQNLGGVNINASAGNPLQSDVNFRGFTASPLLGTAQGLSVYMDGVRVNESFGDVVNWDLIPESAIASVTLTPGSSPAFGLNTLGGALAVQTKSGKQFPGTSAQAYGGSFGRRAAQFETGGSRDDFDAYLTGNFFDEDGWRTASPSHLRQLFGKLGWEDERSDVDLSYAWADSNLTGNGLTPQSMLAQDRATVYTSPDNTKNHLNFVNLRGSHFLNDTLLLGGNTYFRQLQTRTYNGDVNDQYSDDFETLVDTGGACAADADPEACASSALAGETGRITQGKLSQRSYGGALQLTSTTPLLQHENQWILGLSHDAGRNDFAQQEQEATLNPDRTTTPTDVPEPETSLYGTTTTSSVYFTDTWSPNSDLHLTASARYNRSHVVLEDRLGTELNGDHHYNRLNPGLGFTLTPRKTLTLYGGYNEGSRIPTPIELGCADPAIPCKLPNAMASDPPLEQVVARTWEAGMRGKVERSGVNWSLALFRTRSSNDIQFISSAVSGAGYFANVGDTRRQGLELALDGKLGKLSWNAGYSWVDARYRSALSLVAEDNSTADSQGFISVQPGDRIPMIPQHAGKLVIDYAITPRWSAGGNFTVQSGSDVRGNENNLHQPGVNADGVDFLGTGRIGGFAVLNLRTRYQLSDRCELFARINNALDRNYQTAGTLGINPFAADGSFQSEPDEWRRETLYSPGAPLSAWAGVELRL